MLRVIFRFSVENNSSREQDSSPVALFTVIISNSEPVRSTSDLSCSTGSEPPDGFIMDTELLRIHNVVEAVVLWNDSELTDEWLTSRLDGETGLAQRAR